MNIFSIFKAPNVPGGNHNIIKYQAQSTILSLFSPQNIELNNRQENKCDKQNKKQQFKKKNK